MKTLVITLLSFFIFTNCEQKESNDIQPNNTFSFKIDGEGYSPDPIINIQNLSEIPFVGIYGEFGNKEAMFLIIRQDVQAGNHSIDISNEMGVTQSQARYYYNPNSLDIATVANAVDGVITITKNDTDGRRMSGTFSFKTLPVETDQTVFDVTEGKFEVTY